MPICDDTKELYDHSASRWVRESPTSLSDFTARPSVLDLCEPIDGAEILDLGCGEGYCSRKLRRRGAKRVLGIDLSKGMIEAARACEASAPLGIEYEVGSATNLEGLPDRSFGLVLAVFLFNYLDVSQTRRCMAEVARVLRPGGSFVFAIPHPAFPFVRKEGEFPFHFEDVGGDYFGSRNALFSGRIWKTSGAWLDVQLVHKTLQDYFEALQSAGFSSMPTLRELHVTADHLELDRSFFGPIAGIPLHVAIRVER